MNRVAAPLRERVTNVLRQAILDSELEPGQRLVERELIEKLQVSRTTIRESLRELTAEGLVTVIPQRGAVVATTSHDDAADLYDARIAVESLLVDRFVRRATDEQVGRLRDAVSKLRAATDSQRPVRDILAAKDHFYAELVDGANSTVLANLLISLHARVSIMRATSLAQPGRPDRAVEEIEATVEAIVRRDSRSATQLCATHLRNAAETGLSALERMNSTIQKPTLGSEPGTADSGRVSE
jgi:DNA-binding GntR family transcriptional regulator